MPEFLTPEWLALLGSSLGRVDLSLEVRLRLIVTDATTYDVVFSGGTGRVDPQATADADITLRLARETAAGLASGTRTAHDALDAGEVTVSGDLRVLGALTEAVATLGEALGRVREHTTYP